MHIIIALSGDDAVKFESLPDEVIVAKALSVLRSIFGDTTVPEVCLFTPDSSRSFSLSCMCIFLA